MVAIRIGFGLMALLFLALAAHQGLLAARVLDIASADGIAAVVAAIGGVAATVGTAYTAWKVR
ncbi:hypothetical protein [Roseospira visakhapatnamensis]|uniref:Putative nicotinamide N-methyase n=1 Tax=Roseospira visakhapatnamensis TaxID=390880 RepID=A0A7W6W968_9PROT|nr:hypothetical protein [Roseospira visakhapatnamensis]MBB4265161.1 putative nicotinamide N-methyase [Roseospira visakhapatnamensis]